MRARRARRQELLNIASLGDFNELTISGHVEQRPVLGKDDWGRRACEFVLTHTSAFGSSWERECYDVVAYDEHGERYAADWQPGQTVLIAGWLAQHDCQTLAGPVRGARIAAWTIDTTLGLHPHTRDLQETGG
ncbi:MAG: hypothetical protein ACRDLN_10505 [Solirubrobacteraceae bacterium]